MKKETTHIRIRLSTKERLDRLSEFLGRKIIDVVDDCISAYQVGIIKKNMEIAERREKGEL